MTDATRERRVRAAGPHQETPLHALARPAHRNPVPYPIFAQAVRPPRPVPCTTEPNPGLPPICGCRGNVGQSTIDGSTERHHIIDS